MLEIAPYWRPRLVVYAPTPVSKPEDPIRVTFFAEADELLLRLEGDLEALEGADDRGETIAALFRNAHTLKGSALVAGVRPIGELAHVLEELFSRWRDGKLQPTPPQITWARQSLDMLRDSVRIEVLGGSAAQADTGANGEGAQGTFLRVELAKLNAIADTIGELSLARSQERALVSSLPMEFRTDLADAYEASDRHYRDLYERSLRLRLVSFEALFTSLSRAAQQVARKLGKSVTVQSVGAELEVDAAIVANLKDPLMHMIRNAVDHGIESPEARSLAGKPATGEVKIVARRAGGNVVIELSDDGKGLDHARILQKARERGQDLSLAQLTEDMLANLIFEAGFSTAATVTDVSGRGVGMDVVRSNVQQMRGEIRVRSKSGAGSTFEIQVPLALALVQGFQVGVGRNCFVLPADAVECCLDAAAVELVNKKANSGECISYQGQWIPLVRLGRTLGLPESLVERESAIVVRTSGELVAFCVDRLGGEQQTVVRTLGPMFQSIQSVSGATVLGNGEVALLLDIPRVVEAARRRLSA
jgi:two-component system chemotaxis sensor kinase CheA